MPASTIIPAYRAAAAIAETVRAARQLSGVQEIIVVDDGSDNGTGEAARSAGADAVIALPANRGKGAALSAGIAVANADQLLFLDADLGQSAARARPLLDALSEIPGPGMTVAVLPSRPGGGGFGLAMGLARVAIRLLSGMKSEAPMSGQRAISATLIRHIGIAPRFGVEVALTVEAAHVGAAIQEIPLPLEHARTGRDFAGFAHRARQFKDILRFLLLTGYGLGWPALPAGTVMRRALLWIFALIAVIALGRIASPAAFAGAALACAAALVLWLPVLWLAAVTLGLRKPNYLGRHLPSGAGLLFPLVGVPALLISGIEPPEKWAGIATISAFGLLGLVDDLYASGRQARGLRGHLRALSRGRISTGALKALGGIATGVVAGLLLDADRAWLVAVDALLIALAANSVNLLDLRPGRALKGFALLCAVSLVAAPNSLHLLAPLLVAAIVSAPADLAGRAMMGDVGANALGAAAGLGLVLVLSPWARLAALVILVAFHLLCEQRSLTEMIERNRALRFLDRLGTAHLAPLPSTSSAEPGQAR
jgi:UDP-N-acetylmuramyl pentapeptide phosphotransferase/UDP-N-acetylglucosamine-1-phosphate transferase